MVRDRPKDESSRLDEWQMKNMSGRYSLASHAFVFSIAYGIYERETGTRECGDRRRRFLSRAHANERANITHRKSSQS